MGFRRNQACLSARERAEFVAALRALKASGAYDAFVEQHRAAVLFTTPDPAHRGPAFLPWHREYLRRFELALQAVDPSVTLPYWDWSADRTARSPLWSPDFMGGDGAGPGDRVTTGPFADWALTVLDPGERDPFLKRTLGAVVASLPSVEQVRSALAVTPYDSAPWVFGSTGFRNSLEAAPLHNSVHLWVGGSMMSASAPNDPVFWLHHCNVDRLWAMWQRQHPGQAYLPPGGAPGAPVGHALDDPMPPWAGEPDPPTPRRVLDHRALGYEYDTETLVGDLCATEGRPTLLRVHDIGTRYGPPTDQLDVEVVLCLDSEPGRAFGFTLRADDNEPPHAGMLDLLRDAFSWDRRVRINYVRTGSCNGRIVRVTGIL
jgi:tyrosinase